LRKKISAHRETALVKAAPAPPVEASFAEVVSLIQQARQSAFQAVNTELVGLYWQVGEYISRKLETAEWGDGVVDQLACYIQRYHPNLRGFTRASLFRMRQFFEIYCGDKKVAPLVRQLPWSHHLIILGQCKRPEEREFYMRLAIREGWGKRELERQLRTALFERAILSPAKMSSRVSQTHPDALNIFRDSYVVEFLDLTNDHAESDLHRGLVGKLKDFLIELGRDFCFIGSEYPVQVGGRDFALDLLLFHRGLNCLVAIELKVDRFEPEYLGKLEFYLEALDRNVRKPHERLSIGMLLCATRDSEVVEYALSRSLSPALVAEYQTRLPDKKLLQAKLHEFYALHAPEQLATTAPLETNPESLSSATSRARSPLFSMSAFAGNGLSGLVSSVPSAQATIEEDVRIAQSRNALLLRAAIVWLLFRETTADQRNRFRCPSVSHPSHALKNSQPRARPHLYQPVSAMAAILKRHRQPLGQRDHQAMFRRYEDSAVSHRKCLTALHLAMF